MFTPGLGEITVLAADEARAGPGPEVNIEVTSAPHTAARGIGR
jgi:hypothetical protein